MSTLSGIRPQRQLLRQNCRRCNCCSGIHLVGAAGLRSSISKLAAVLNVEIVERPGYGQQYESCTTHTTDGAMQSVQVLMVCQYGHQLRGVTQCTDKS